MKAKVWIRHALAAIAAAVICAVLAARADDPVPNDKCFECHLDKDLVETNSQGRVISLFFDTNLFAASVHATNSCVSCHSDITWNHPDDNLAAKPVNCAICHSSESDSYSASVHGLALKAGKPGVATCKDCHGHHDILPATSPESRTYFSRLAATCGNCHAQAAADVSESVHGQSAARGVREAPTCTDCHSEHKIQSLTGKSSVKISEVICARCHDSAAINAKFQMPADRVTTFYESYHGLAAQGGLARAANCASCHGYHKILPSTDPRSSINKNHLVETCGKCHPGATANFAFGRVHVDGTSGTDTGAVTNIWVRRIYLILIFAVIGTLSTHNLIAWLRAAQAARAARGETVIRMSRGQRLQHFTLASCFILLALTGFALKYPDTWLGWVFGNEEIRRWLHRIAGVIMLGLGGYHVGYILATKSGRQLVKDFWPRWQDAKDCFLNVRYLSGHSKERAKFGRFGYPEKLEYWAVVWGVIIMGTTGIMIWAKLDVTQYLPRWIIDVATTIHYYEAILACLAILVWHFYHVIFAPDVYPMNWAWWDGKVSKHWQQEEHPLEKLPEQSKPNSSGPPTTPASGKK